jgi:hypothetical protein
VLDGSITEIENIVDTIEYMAKPTSKESIVVSHQSINFASDFDIQ